MKANRREEERYKEEYEKGVRRKKDLEEVDEYFQQVSEEVNKVEEYYDEEGKKVYDVLMSVAHIVHAKIRNEEEMRKRGERDYVSYWEKIREMISIARFCEVNLENMENMDRELENFLNSEVDADFLEEEEVDQEKGERSLENLEVSLENMEREVENFLNSEVDDDLLEEEKGENEE